MVENKKGKRMALKIETGTLEELVSLRAIKLGPFAKHLANGKWQSQQFEHLKKNVPPNWVVMCMDFGEN